MNIIVGDVGGTNTRLGIFNTKNNKTKKIKIFSTKNINIYDEINKLEREEKIKGISLAVAGPKTKEDIKLTNNNKKIIKKKLSKQNFKILIINDFEALGYYIKHTEKEKSIAIGAGTGLGKVFINQNIMSSEAGHTDFPFYENEKKIQKFFYKKLKRTPEYEDVVSGKGIVNIKEFYNNKKLTQKEKHPSEIFLKKNKINTKTIKEFSKFYGRFIKNSYIDFIPKKIFISGGIARKNPEIIKTKEFKQELKHRLIKKPKIKLIKEKYAELKGAGLAFKYKDI